MGKLRTQEDLKKINCPNHIKTKAIRQSINSKDRHAKRKLQKKERLKRRKAGEAPGIPRTLENTRERDDTVLDTAETERVEEVQQDVATDEFQNYFEKSYEPKVLITFSDNPLKKTRVFGIELSRMIPNSLVRYRNRASVKKMIESAKRRNFSDIIIVNENMRQPNGLLLVHLPDGPTAHFRLSNVKITTELKKNHKNITSHRPEVIVNNFSTRLGLTIGRMLSSVFHYDPEFKGRRVVTFHNQRDYIFFRHHRYEFKENGKPRLKELGPRFTLRLQSLQKGTFDSKCGEYEWIQTSRRHEIETSRRRFFL